LICCFLLLITTSFAQLDSTYIGKYEQNLSVKGFVYGNLLQISTREANETNQVDYIPNNPVCVGVGIMYEKFPFEIVFGHKVGVKENDNYLKTEYFDLQLHKYGQNFSTDAFVQQYQGLYIDDQKLPIKESNCPDISVLQLGLVGQYLFNGEKFSNKAAFNQTEKQLKSAGSLLVGLGVYYFKIDSDSSFAFRAKNNIQSFQCGVNVGYAYNWAIKKSWLVCGSLTLGVNLGNHSVNPFFDKSLYLTPSILEKSSVYYNHENWSLGMSFVINAMILSYPDESEVDLGSGRFYITYVQRMDLKSNLSAKGKHK